MDEVSRALSGIPLPLGALSLFSEFTCIQNGKSVTISKRIFKIFKFRGKKPEPARVIWVKFQRKAERNSPPAWLSFCPPIACKKVLKKIENACKKTAGTRVL